MQNRKLRTLGVLLAFVILGGVVASCKTHEVCPAYTKIEKSNDKF